MALLGTKMALLGAKFGIFKMALLGTKMALLGENLAFLVLKWHCWAQTGLFRCKIAIFSAKVTLLGTKMALLGAKLPFSGLKWHF